MLTTAILYTGINGVLALKDEAYKRGWLVVAHEHFEPVPDPSKLDITKQLKWIRQTGTRVVVLNCYVKYSREVRSLLFRVKLHPFSTSA